MQKITGIGGVSFKSKNPKQLMDWYSAHLGLTFTHGFIEFKWTDDPAHTTSASTAFSISKEDSDNFKPSDKSFMINFRVSDLRALIGELKEKGVTVSEELQEYDFGKFGWLIDPEGNKIELWEPIDNG